MLFIFSLLMIFFWLLVFSMMHTSGVSIMKLRCITCAELMILFAHSWDLFRIVRVSELITCNATSSLSRLRSNMIKSHCIIDALLILWKICLIDFFCIFFTSFFFIIFIRTSRSLRSNNSSSLSCCFLIVAASSFATSVHDDVLNIKHVFSCICCCLLKSWMNIFNFYTFFAMNASWLSIFFSETFQRRWISFRITSFHE